MLYNIVLVSAAHQHEAAIGTCVTWDGWRGGLEWEAGLGALGFEEAASHGQKDLYRPLQMSLWQLLGWCFRGRGSLEAPGEWSGRENLPHPAPTLPQCPPLWPKPSPLAAAWPWFSLRFQSTLRGDSWGDSEGPRGKWELGARLSPFLFPRVL